MLVAVLSSIKRDLFFITFSIFWSFGMCQSELDEVKIPLNTGSRYVTTVDGVLRMYVNIWGHVHDPGRIMVDEGIDMATLLSLTGGPQKGANLKNISIYREYPDKSGKSLLEVDFTEFLETGDRSNFIAIQPNDTFIIKQTLGSYLIGEIGTLNTVMNLFNFSLNLINLLGK